MINNLTNTENALQGKQFCIGLVHFLFHAIYTQ
jgi:hypothetical protein